MDYIRRTVIVEIANEEIRDTILTALDKAEKYDKEHIENIALKNKCRIGLSGMCESCTIENCHARKLK